MSLSRFWAVAPVILSVIVLEVVSLRVRVPRPPNYPLIYPKYLLLRAIRAPLKGPRGVLVVWNAKIGFGVWGFQPEGFGEFGVRV